MYEGMTMREELRARLENQQSLHDRLVLLLLAVVTAPSSDAELQATAMLYKYGDAQGVTQADIDQAEAEVREFTLRHGGTPVPRFDTIPPEWFPATPGSGQ